jgi:hypothetical protein
METTQVVKRGRKPRAASADNGRNGENPAGAIEGAEAGSEHLAPVTIDLVASPTPSKTMPWEELSAYVAKMQDADTERRIVRVWHTSGPDMWTGRFGNAPVAHGKPAFQWNTGEITNL